MKRIEINRASWHYRLLAFRDKYDVPDDICAYTRKLLTTLFYAFLLAIVALLFLWSLGDALAWAVACFRYWEWLDLGIGIVAAVLVGPFSVLMTAAVIKYWMPDKPKDFVVTAWEHFHDKTCARLSFRGDK